MRSTQKWLWTGLKGTRKLQDQVAQMPMTYTTVVPVHLPQFMPTALWVPHQITWSRRKKLGLWKGWVNMRVQAKTGSGWNIASLGGWGTWCTWLPTLGGKRSGPRLKYLWIYDQWWMAWLAGRVWKEKDWMIENKEIWGRGMWLDMWDWSLSMKIFASHVNTHQRAYSSEEALNNQIDKMTRAVDISQSLSLAIPVMAWWAQWHKWRRCMDPTAWTASYQGWSSLCYCRMFNLPSTETTTEPPVWHHSLGRPYGNLKASS